MKRILVSLALATLALAGCGGAPARGGEPNAPSPAAARSSAGIAPDVTGCAMARTLSAASSIGDFATVGAVLSGAQDGALADAGVRLAGEAARLSASRSAVYAAYLDVMDECLRVSP
jgi:hypothetical protein